MVVIILYKKVNFYYIWYIIEHYNNFNNNIYKD